jgi:lysophospholipase L1-like esterase
MVEYNGATTRDYSGDRMPQSLPELRSSLKLSALRFNSLSGGRTWAFCGDSITDGASSSNTSVDSYRAMVPKIVGSVKVSPSSINGGVPGDRSDQLLARIDSIIAQNPGSAFVMIGTNDAEQLIPLADYQTNVIAIVSKFRIAGIPVALGTVPPRTVAAATEKHALIGQYNLWLRIWAPQNGIKLAATHTALVDPLTGYYTASLVSGDGIHPNDAGHLAIAKAVALVVDEMVITQPWPVNGPQPGIGMISNPLMAGAGPATSWAINAGIGSGIAGVAGVAAPVGNDLPFGQWATLRMDGTTTAGTRYMLTAATGFSAGDRIVIYCYLKSTDVSGTGLSVVLLNSSTGLSVVSAPINTLKTGTPGPVMVAFTMPDPAPASGSLRFGIGQSVSVGQDITASIGAAQLYNLTTGNMATLL